MALPQGAVSVMHVTVRLVLREHVIVQTRWETESVSLHTFTFTFIAHSHVWIHEIIPLWVYRNFHFLYDLSTRFIACLKFYSVFEVFWCVTAELLFGDVTEATDDLMVLCFRLMEDRSRHMRLREWLIAQIDSGNYPGLSWENQEKTMFRIPWKHAAKQDYRQNQDAALFKVNTHTHTHIYYRNILTTIRMSDQTNKTYNVILFHLYQHIAFNLPFQL